MWTFLFGWMAGRGLSRASAIPDSVRQQRYDAAMERKERKRQQRAEVMASSFGRVAYVFFAVALVIYVVAVLR